MSSQTTSSMTPDPSRERQYYMDWLRVLAILIVFSAHAAMPFNSEPGVWLIQDRQTSLVFTLYVAFWYQWIMQLFFFLAGSGAGLALARRGPAQAGTWLRMSAPRVHRG